MPPPGRPGDKPPSALHTDATLLPGRGSVAVATPVPALPAALAGLTQYEDVRELGRGGMGVVYLARNKLMNRSEVLKVVGREHLHRPGAKERFLQEVQSAARLQHPNVVTAYSVAEAGDGLVFAMEYVPGDDLLKVIRSGGPLAVPQACFYTAQVAQGLQHAAGRGMVHRDIKPANLILTRDGKRAVVKILDFGLAKMTSEQATDGGLTGDGQMMGTPDYIAPEQARDAAKADTRADIYSLGCTLYHLLAGDTPFRDSSLTSLLLRHQTETARPLNVVRADVPAELAAVVARMLAKRPEERYQTPGEVAAALKPFFTAKTAGPTGAASAVPLLAVAAAIPLPPETANPWAEVTAQPETKTARPAPARRELDEDDRPRKARRREEPPQPTPRSKWLWPAVAVGGLVLVLGLGLIVAFAAGVFVTTKEGTIELTDLPPDADVFVDGEKVTVTWDGGKQKAEVRAKPGSHKVEVKRGDTVVSGDTVEVESGGKKVLTVKLKGDKPPPTGKKDDPAAFTPLFNGKDLTGWKTHKSQPGDWRAEDGVLIGSGPRANGVTSYLYTERDDYKDFHVRAECRVNDGGNSGLLGRCGFGPATPAGKPVYADGYEAQLNSTHKDPNRTGSLYVSGDGVPVALKESPVRPNEWCTLELIAEGNRLTVKVNGKTTAEYTDDKRRFARGHIALQQLDAGTVCEFRKIEIKELP